MKKLLLLLLLLLSLGLTSISYADNLDDLTKEQLCKLIPKMSGVMGGLIGYGAGDIAAADVVAEIKSVNKLN
jgi:hypothetical protein